MASLEIYKLKSMQSASMISLIEAPGMERTSCSALKYALAQLMSA
ncbi:2964_t:CDS:2 [Diversispora eburnea]|uniref:2964_t:CDS:1 n=1 Tax=Diversispora eburnea TaxID=1213867 RepID=A0A9N9FYS0_9GLOM|nr:2964_t:CDS:2 [Diversispora eburnea]